MNTPMITRVLSVTLSCLIVICSQASLPAKAMRLAPTTIACESKSGTDFYMRAGPGFQYESAGLVETPTVAQATARDQSSKWLRITANEREGWSIAAVLKCDSDIKRLPVDPTATNANNGNGKKVTVRKSRAPDGGVNYPDFVAELYTAPVAAMKNFGTLENVPVFRDALSFRVKVYDQTQGSNDGDGIEYVQFNFREYTLDDQGNPTPSDNPSHDYPPDATPSFCAFAGDDPSCNPALRPDETWPDGLYEMTVQMQGTEDDPNGGKKFTNWNQYFFAIQRSAGGGASTQTALVVRLAQTGPESTDTTVADELVFQVEAYDPKVGEQDGDGIASVDLEIFGPNGRRVYRNTEKTPHYCAFQGGEPDCNVWRFSDHNFRWPNNGPRLQQGQTYTLHVVVHAKNGNKKQGQWTIELQ
ncbi:hypothetical protein BH10CHL1_BH10CHL1_23660 [soil metagenome]